MPAGKVRVTIEVVEASAPPAQTLQEWLADLRDRGAITPEEYEAKKAELLDRL